MVFRIMTLAQMTSIALMRMSWCVAIVGLAVISAARPAVSGTQNAAVCGQVAKAAAQKTGVPEAVLQTISLTETGRNTGGSFGPWPWTVNMEGKGLWFDTRVEALDFVHRNLARGALSFDVGCFQLNYRWHGKAFASVEDMFDPALNAIYAATFLRELYAEKGNWADAAGAYHSRTPKYANRYKARFNKLLASFPGGSELAPPIVLAVENDAPHVTLPAAPETQRQNNFPLFLGGGRAPASLGSLMPMEAGAGQHRLVGEG
jgi:hypothetical protein